MLISVSEVISYLYRPQLASNWK